MGRKKIGRCAKFARKSQTNAEPEEFKKAPHSFVINRGPLGKTANELLLNFRKVMEPFTASHLKVKKQNVLKDFVHIAGPLNVTHLVTFSKSPKALYMRVAKLPHGPTLTFQIKEYSLVRDIISSQKKSVMYEKLFVHHPLLILNNFSGEGMHFKLMATTFQNMFPSINVNKTNLNTIRRTVLLNYNEDKTIDFRQYAVKVVPTGISKAVKKLIQSKVPDLSRYQEIDDFLQKSGNLSESEVEMDTAANTVVLPQPISSRGNITSEKSAIRLYEIGPRLKLQLLKIEEGLLAGEVLFHEYVKKTPEEIKALKAKMKAKKLLKQQRREQQNKNVARKKAAEAKNSENGTAEEGNENEEGNEQEEELQWYREEVGEEPDEGTVRLSKKRKTGDRPLKKKKVKISEKVNKNVIGSKNITKKVRFSNEKVLKTKNSRKVKVLSHSAKNRKNFSGMKRRK